MKLHALIIYLFFLPAFAFDNPAVLTIMQDRCISCHGPDKIKGGLRVDSMSEIWRGGDSGAVLIPGKPLESSLYTLCALDPEDPDRMPGKGRPLTTEQLQVLYDWITALPADEMMPDDMMMGGDIHGQTATIPREKQLFADPWQELSQDLPELAPSTIISGRQLGLLVEDVGDGLLSVAAGFRGTSWTAEDSLWLQSVAPHVVSLDLRQSGLSELPPLDALVRLRHLQIRGNSLSQLPSAVAGVQVLNVTDNPQLDDQALGVLKTWPDLQRVHVHGTQATPQLRLNDVEIVH